MSNVGEIEIHDLSAVGAAAREAAAALLYAAFAENWPLAWPNMQEARDEVAAALGDDRIARIALDRDERPVGWCAAVGGYHGHTWELHPLAVDPAWHRRGVGTRLLADLESRVAAAGGGTMWLGADDENGLTSLSGLDLYPNVLEKLATVENLGAHPMSFYRKQGYAIVGVIPDGAAPGQPDILMAKRLVSK